MRTAKQSSKKPTLVGTIDGLSWATIIRMGELGNLRITISSEGKMSAQEVSGASVKKAGIIFTPGARLREMLKTVKFQKV